MYCYFLFDSVSEISEIFKNRSLVDLPIKEKNHSCAKCPLSRLSDFPIALLSILHLATFHKHSINLKYTLYFHSPENKLVYFHLKIKIFVEKYIFCIKNTVVLLFDYTNTVWPKGLSIKIEFNKKFKSLINICS